MEEEHQTVCPLAAAGIAPTSEEPPAEEPVEKICKAVVHAKDLDEFRTLVEGLEGGAFSEARPQDGMSPLMVAACEDRADIVEELLERGADPGALTQDRVFRMPPVDLALVGGRNLLHLAYRHGASETLLQLLERRFPLMAEARDLNGLLPAELSRRTHDPVLPTRRRMLRTADLSPFERFAGVPFASFFADPSSGLERLAPGISRFQMVAPENAAALLQYIEQFSPSTRTRPNTMNLHGHNLRDSAAWDLISAMMVSYAPALMRQHHKIAVQPYAQGQVPLPPFAEGFQSRLDPAFEITDHYSFLIRYHDSHQDPQHGGSGKDRLDFHYDAAYFTINLCLDLPSDPLSHGSTLYFDYTGSHDPSDFDSVGTLFPLTHSPGSAILHDGKLRHGAGPISNGSRANLIIWAK